MRTRCWEFEPELKRKVVVLFHFQGWHSIQIGIHFDLKMINFELHLPFCFVRIGKESAFKACTCKTAPEELEEAQKQRPTNAGVSFANQNDILASDVG